ncbi:hypothetical protein HPO96_19665 [Kribbella sandramycini]|uniref:Preprotein translocase subunit SecD n=1 Tax=Kribbella sandramycini TaxID=60450 RepID=A0A7Y4P113_9ACTN|nr:hypothetical protein [Kribbella sandramycini]MBB6564767.1 preprotein translocase subunit SecD [Kribbella sandramycini]NOL42468.1 hypothetical protein [Kribbella sandramycini]
MAQSVSARQRGLLVVLALLLVTLVVLVTVVVVRRFDGTPAPTEPKRAAAETLQFRRVVAVKPDGCTAGPSVLCGVDGAQYTLGAVEVDGSQVMRTEAGPAQGATGWVVTLTLDAEGTKLFSALTTELVKNRPPKNQLAIVVKDQVVSAPTVSGAITAGQVQIAGNFTRAQAEKLAADITG